MKLVIQFLLTFMFVFLIQIFWPEDSAWKPVLIGIACVGVFFIVEMIYKKKEKKHPR